MHVSCYETRKTTLGDNHPCTLASMNNLGLLYNNQGKYDLAEPLDVSCYEMRKTELRGDLHGTSAYLGDWGILNNNQG